MQSVQECEAEATAHPASTPRSPMVWIVQAVLAVYLLPVVAVVVAVGGVALTTTAFARGANGLVKALTGTPRRARRVRIRHEPHVALPMSVTASRICR